MKRDTMTVGPREPDEIVSESVGKTPKGIPM
jgi:hypothetical protein